MRRAAGSKYGAKKTPCGHGHTHDSKLEARRCEMLHMELRAGTISHLRFQTPYAFEEGGRVMFRYVSDFDYMRGDVHVVEDAKGMPTPVFNLKRKLIEARFGMEISLWPVPKAEARKQEAKERRVERDLAKRAAATLRAEKAAERRSRGKPRRSRRATAEDLFSLPGD